MTKKSEKKEKISSSIFHIFFSFWFITRNQQKWPLDDGRVVFRFASFSCLDTEEAKVVSVSSLTTRRDEEETTTNTETVRLVFDDDDEKGLAGEGELRNRRRRFRRRRRRNNNQTLTNLDDENDENDDKDDAKENARVPGRVFSLRDMGVRVVYSERFRKSWGSVDFDGAV